TVGHGTTALDPPGRGPGCRPAPCRRARACGRRDPFRIPAGPPAGQRGRRGRTGRHDPTPRAAGGPVSELTPGVTSRTMTVAGAGRGDRPAGLARPGPNHGASPPT